MECVKFPFQLDPRGNYGPGSNDDDDEIKPHGQIK